MGSGTVRVRLRGDEWVVSRDDHATTLSTFGFEARDEAIADAQDIAYRTSYFRKVIVELPPRRRSQPSER